LYGWCFYHSPAAEGALLGGALLSLYLLDQTVHFLLAAGHPHRPRQKQVRAYRRKRSLTPTTHCSQATSETAISHQGRSYPPRSAGQAGSDLTASPLHCSTRHPAPRAAEGRCRNDCFEETRWRRTIAVFVAERIRGELLKLGLRVCKRTIQKYMRGVRTKPPRGQKWSTFLHTHAAQIWACDFLQVTDLFFRPLFAFFLTLLHSRKVIHVRVTRSPTDAWVAQQLREATPYGQAPK
jgi:hypothetical protein